MQTVDVALEDRAYQVQVGHAILPQIGDLCRPLGLGQRVAIIADRAVADPYLEPVVASLREAGYDPLEILFSGGDAAKNLTTAEQIFGRLIAAELDRSAWILALGGGVVGDLAGFVAATFLRGVPFVQAPTTIVAQVDASVGGKTAVNHALGKNLIGAFHQPRLVLIDTDVLRTLPRRELVAGMGEVVKHAVIRDPELFAFLEEHLERIVDLELEPDRLDWLIARNVQIKARVVEIDEREGGLRAILNYGHTVGHAIEAAGEYTRYRHGEGVILGMVAAGEIAVCRNLWSDAERQRQDTLLTRLEIPTGLREIPTAQILERTRTDKKRVSGRLRFVLPRRIGQVEIVDDVPEETVSAAIEYVQRNY